jgi:hypothetical protein
MFKKWSMVFAIVLGLSVLAGAKPAAAAVPSVWINATQTYSDHINIAVGYSTVPSGWTAEAQVCSGGNCGDTYVFGSTYLHTYSYFWVSIWNCFDGGYYHGYWVNVYWPGHGFSTTDTVSIRRYCPQP